MNSLTKNLLTEVCKSLVPKINHRLTIKTGEFDVAELLALVELDSQVTPLDSQVVPKKKAVKDKQLPGTNQCVYIFKRGLDKKIDTRCTETALIDMEYCKKCIVKKNVQKKLNTAVTVESNVTADPNLQLILLTPPNFYRTNFDLVVVLQNDILWLIGHWAPDTEKKWVPFNDADIELAKKNNIYICEDIKFTSVAATPITPVPVAATPITPPPVAIAPVPIPVKKPVIRLPEFKKQE